MAQPGDEAAVTITTKPATEHRYQYKGYMRVEVEGFYGDYAIYQVLPDGRQFFRDELSPDEFKQLMEQVSDECTEEED